MGFFMSERTRNYTMQRNYDFDSHDENGNFNGLTEDEWKQQISDDWTCDKLNAKHITFVFHDKDLDDNGLPKSLHAHGCTNFVDAITQSEAIKRTGCSSDLNCTPIRNKANAYRYLLHITEKAIKADKHIYSEDELIIRVKDGVKFNYHKMIHASDEEEKEKDYNKLLNAVVQNIKNGCYDEVGKSVPSRQNIFNKLLLNDDINNLVSINPKYRRYIENAIDIRCITIYLQRN